MHPDPLHPQSTYSRQSVRYAYLKIQPHVLRYKWYILELLPYLFFILNLICFFLKNREYLIYYHQGRIFIRPLDYTIDSIKIHLLSLQHCFFFLLFRNLLMNVGIIQPVQICILTNLIIKRNHHRATLDKSHSRCGIGYKSKLCLWYSDNLCHLGTVRIRLL